eukprot:768-Pelagococcus_subviridis.AAC.6
MNVISSFTSRAAGASFMTTGTLRGQKICRTATASSNSRYVRKHILELAPYTPILPFEVLSEKFGFLPEDIVKLDANENPYGPPPEVAEALSSLKFPHVYPDPESRQLRQTLAKETGVPFENLIIGCGADELIDLLMRVVIDPNDVVINTPPTFGMYAFDCAVNGGTVVDVPRCNADGFKIDVEAIQRAVYKHKPKLLFLTSPNNPDGCVLSDRELLLMLELPVLVVLDEAYIEFASCKSHIADVVKYDNLIVLRTFSKCAALAGMRVGYGAFPKGLIDYIWRAKQPYNVSAAAEVAACAALSNPEYLQEVKGKLVQERTRLHSLLSRISYLKPYPSEANFVLVIGRDALQLKEKLAKNGIMVRHYSSPESISGCIRISVGRPEQTDAIVAVLSAI